MADHDTHDHTGVPGVGSGDLTNPMTTSGDVIYGGASGTPTRLAKGTDGEVLTLASGLPSWAASVGGGGLTQAFVGYNTVGASFEATVNGKIMFKQVTLANACLLTSVDVYVKGNAANGEIMAGGVYSDSAGVPTLFLGGSVQHSNGTFMSATPRWLSMPVGIWLAAGTYQLAFSTNSNVVQIAYDGSGSDHYYSATGGAWWIDSWGATDNTSANKYSIRGNTIR